MSRSSSPPTAYPEPLRTVLVDVRCITKPSTAFLAAMAEHADTEHLRRHREQQALGAASETGGSVQHLMPFLSVRRSASPANFVMPSTTIGSGDGESAGGVRQFSRHLVVPLVPGEHVFWERPVKPEDRTRRQGNAAEDSVRPTPLAEPNKVWLSIGAAVAALPDRVKHDTMSLAAIREKGREVHRATAGLNSSTSGSGGIQSEPAIQRITSSTMKSVPTPRRGKKNDAALFFSADVRRDATSIRLSREALCQGDGGGVTSATSNPALEVDWSSPSKRNALPRRLETMLIEKGILHVDDSVVATSRKPVPPPCITPRRAFIESERQRLTAVRTFHSLATDGRRDGGGSGGRIAYRYPQRPPARAHGNSDGVLARVVAPPDDPIVAMIASAAPSVSATVSAARRRRSRQKSGRVVVD